MIKLKGIRLSKPRKRREDIGGDDEHWVDGGYNVQVICFRYSTNQG